MSYGYKWKNENNIRAWWDEEIGTAENSGSRQGYDSDWIQRGIHLSVPDCLAERSSWINSDILYHDVYIA